MKHLITLTIILFALTIAAQAAEPKSGTPGKPNIIFIMADEVEFKDLSCYGQKQFQTPQIDRLASGGRMFTNAYAGGPWCAPSRTALLTGMNGSHFNVMARDAKGRPTKFRPTVAEMLKSAGYATCALGKWHMLEGGQDSWLSGQTLAENKPKINWNQMPWHRGFDVCRIGGFNECNLHYPHEIVCSDTEVWNFPENKNVDKAYIVHENPRIGPNAAKMYDTQGRFVDRAGTNSSRLRYAEDIYRAEAVSFIRANKDKPFFLYYATCMVHNFKAAKDIGPWKDKPGWTIYEKVYVSMIRELDTSVGAILDEVRKLGLENNTIILFATDNGSNPEPDKNDVLYVKEWAKWRGGKFSADIGGVIVPFIAWGPGRVPAGTKTDRAINFYDFLATAGELSGAKLPGPTDGVSFVPLLEGRDTDQPLRADMVWPKTSLRFWKGERDEWAPVQQQTSKLYLPDAALLDEKWYAMQLGQTIRLFDITTDPGMKHDLSAQRPDLRDRATDVFQKLNNQRK